MYNLTLKSGPVLVEAVPFIQGNWDELKNFLGDDGKVEIWDARELGRTYAATVRFRTGGLEILMDTDYLCRKLDKTLPLQDRYFWSRRENMDPWVEVR